MKKNTLIAAAFILCLSTTTGFFYRRFDKPMEVKLNIKDLPEEGVVIVSPADASFDELATALLKGATDEEIGLLKPLSVIVKNQGARRVVAHTIVWQCRGANGEQRSFKKVYANSEALTEGEEAVEALLDAGRHEMIEPGGAHLFSLLPSSAGDAGTERESQREARQKFSSELLARYPEITVSIDGVFFDDGTFVGPDTTRFFEKMRAQVDAKLDLVTGISEKVKLGKPHHEIIKDVEGVAALPAVSTPSEARSAEEQYKFWKKLFATQFLSSGRAQGNDRAVAAALRTARKPRKHLRKK